MSEIERLIQDRDNQMELVKLKDKALVLAQQLHKEEVEEARREGFEAGASRALGVMVIHPAFIGTKLLDVDAAYRDYVQAEERKG